MINLMNKKGGLRGLDTGHRRDPEVMKVNGQKSSGRDNESRHYYQELTYGYYDLYGVRNSVYLTTVTDVFKKIHPLFRP